MQKKKEKTGLEEFKGGGRGRKGERSENRRKEGIKLCYFFPFFLVKKKEKNRIF